MKTFPTLALAAMLATGTAGIIAAPAVAKDKKEDAKPGLKLSPEVLKAAQVAQPAIGAKDFATAEPAVLTIETNAKTDDDKYLAAALRYDLEQQKLAAQQTANPNAPINETVLAKPLDALLASPSTPVDRRGRYAYRRGALSYNSKQFGEALRYFAMAKQAGYTDDVIDLQIAQAKIGSGDVKGGLTDLNTAIDRETAAGRKAPEDYYKYGIGKAMATKDNAQSLTWLRKYLQAYPSPKIWRSVVVIYGLQPDSMATLDNPQKIDLYRLIRVNHGLADQNDYGEYAQKTFARGLAGETKNVLQEGIAAGKIPATATSDKALLAAATKANAAEGSLTALEKRAAAGSDGKLAAQTGDAYLGQGNDTKAVELYRLALQKGGVNADEVNTHLGIALGRSGDKAAAATAFGAVTGQPRADIASLWMLWLNGAQG